MTNESLFGENFPLEEETRQNADRQEEDEDLQGFDPSQHPIEVYTTSQEETDCGKPRAPLLTPEKIAHAKRLYIQGETLHEIARILGVPYPSLASTKYYNRWNYTVEEAEQRLKNLEAQGKKEAVYATVTTEIVMQAKELLVRGWRIDDVCKKLNIARTTLQRRLDRDDFHDVEKVDTEQSVNHFVPSRSMREEIASKVVDLTTKQLVAKAEERGVLQAMTDDVAQELRDHAIVGRALMIAVKKTIAEYIAGDLSPARNQNKADLLLSLVNASRGAVSMTREIYGRTSGQASLLSTTKVGTKRFVIATPDEQLSA